MGVKHENRVVNEVPIFLGPSRRASRNLEAFAGLADSDEAEPAWVMFDAACPFCTSVAERIRPMLATRHVFVLPLQTDWVRKLLVARGQPLLKEVRFLNGAGNLFGGADAMVEVARHIWWTRPLALAAKIPGVMKLLRGIYEFVAAHRSCFKSPKWGEHIRSRLPHG